MSKIPAAIGPYSTHRKAGGLIINDLPERLGLHTAELGNERLVIEQVLVCTVSLGGVPLM